MKSLSSHLSDTSKLLDHFSWFLDNAEGADVVQAADLLEAYREDTSTGLWGAAFAFFSLSGKYPDDKQQRHLRAGLAAAANDVAEEAPDAEVKFLLSVLEAGGYKPGTALDKPEKTPVWLHWISAMDAAEVLDDADDETRRRQSFAQASFLFARGRSVEDIEELHDHLSTLIGWRKRQQGAAEDGEPESAQGGPA